MVWLVFGNSMDLTYYCDHSYVVRMRSVYRAFMGDEQLLCFDPRVDTVRPFFNVETTSMSVGPEELIVLMKFRAQYVKQCARCFVAKQFAGKLNCEIQYFFNQNSFLVKSKLKVQFIYFVIRAD